MKILKAGNVPPPRCIQYRGTCNVCKCEVEVLENDPDLQGIGEDLFVKCPTKGCWGNIFMIEPLSEH